MNKIKLMSILLASLILGACSSDDDKTVAYTTTTLSEAPAWQIDWSYNQELPDWTEPDASAYENWTILKVQIEPALLPYASEGDLMALFVNGEIRALARPAFNVSTGKTSNGKFLMKAYGNETDTETVHMSLQYYSDQLKHLFTLSDDINLDSDETIGIDEDFIPEFTSGSAKYPAVKTVAVEGLLAKAGLTPAPGNTVGAFAGEECRGKAVLSETGVTSMVVYGHNAGEALTLKYYEAATGQLFTLTETVKL